MGSPRIQRAAEIFAWLVGINCIRPTGLGARHIRYQIDIPEDRYHIRSHGYTVAQATQAGEHDADDRN
jgi:repressor of nif and glnA expression